MLRLIKLKYYQKITKKNGKRYIGSAVNLRNRFQNYFFNQGSGYILINKKKTLISKSNLLKLIETGKKKAILSVKN
jgi:excinuclease UvrABC nuclease subunit